MSAFHVPTVQEYCATRSYKPGTFGRLIGEISLALHPYADVRVPHVSLEGYIKDVIGKAWDLFRQSETGWDIDYIREGHPFGPAFEFFWNEFQEGGVVDWVTDINDLKHPFLPPTHWAPVFWHERIGPGPFTVHRVERQGDRVLSRHAQRIALIKQGMIWAHGEWMKDSSWPIPDLVTGAWFRKVGFE